MKRYLEYQLRQVQRDGGKTTATAGFYLAEDVPFVHPSTGEAMTKCLRTGMAERRELVFPGDVSDGAVVAAFNTCLLRLLPEYPGRVPRFQQVQVGAGEVQPISEWKVGAERKIAWQPKTKLVVWLDRHSTHVMPWLHWVTGR